MDGDNPPGGAEEEEAEEEEEAVALAGLVRVLSPFFGVLPMPSSFEEEEEEEEAPTLDELRVKGSPLLPMLRWPRTAVRPLLGYWHGPRPLLSPPPPPSILVLSPLSAGAVA